MDIDFSRQLIKGKIAEVIFAEMFSVSEEFSIIPIGYEYTVPELAQYQHHVHIQKVLQNLREAPDFSLISQDKTKVFLVEVKYRATLDKRQILEIANSLYPKWNPIFIFLATQDGFYFDSCKKIIENKGDMHTLSKNWVNENVEKQYLQVLKTFIK